MSVALRVKSLLDRHGDSLRAAEARTGVSRETIRRIADGYAGPTLTYHVIRIARGYGIDEKALLDGLDPKGDFEWTVHHASAFQRLEMVIMSLQDRVRLTLSFLHSKHPSVCSAEVLAAASGLKTEDLTAIIRRWSVNPPDRATALALARGIQRLTGIPLVWFTRGWVTGEDAAKPFADRACRIPVVLTQASQFAPAKTRNFTQLLGKAASG